MILKINQSLSRDLFIQVCRLACGFIQAGLAVFQYEREKNKMRKLARFEKQGN